MENKFTPHTQVKLKGTKDSFKLKLTFKLSARQVPLIGFIKHLGEVSESHDWSCHMTHDF